MTFLLAFGGRLARAINGARGVIDCRNCGQSQALGVEPRGLLKALDHEDLALESN